MLFHDTTHDTTLNIMSVMPLTAYKTIAHKIDKGRSRSPLVERQTLGGQQIYALTVTMHEVSLTHRSMETREAHTWRAVTHNTALWHARLNNKTQRCQATRYTHKVPMVAQ